MADNSARSDSVSENGFFAEKLHEVAALLEQQGASTFRVRAYRDAADHISAMDTSLRRVAETKGRAGLEALPSIGPSIAGLILELLGTGHLALIKRMRGDIDPEKLFQTVPMIGPRLAQVIHQDLELETLEDLEAAAHDGRLRALKGLGPRRVRGIQMELAEILAHRRPRNPSISVPEPPVADILDIDRQYRAAAQEGTLRKIAPKRFNPDGAAWLPILHEERGPWHFTALFSNTPRAHRLGRTRDWVVIHYERDGQAEGQCTVVTEHHGPLSGKRVIRGHEGAVRRIRTSLG